MRTQAIPGALSRILAVIGLSIGLVAMAAPAEAQISVVVAAGSSHAADEGEIAQMFNGAVTSWADGTGVQIVDQAETPVGEAFYDFLGKSPSQVRKAFTALLLSGQASKPEQVTSDDAVKSAVTRSDGAIGYISSSALDDSVKEIARIGG